MSFPGAAAVRRLRPDKAQLLLALALGAAFVVYLPITRIYFVADDFVDMVSIADRGWVHFLVSPFAGHMIFTRNTEVILMYALFGIRHPEAYGWLNLVTHLVNVALLFRVARTLTGSAELAALGAVLWGTCPVLSEALGWFSVHGQIFSGTCVLIVLDGLTRHGKDRVPVAPRTALIWCVVLFLGATCFGGVTAVAITFPALLFLYLDAPLRPTRTLLTVLPLSVVLVVLYTSWNWLYGRFYETPPDLVMLRSLALHSVQPIVKMFAWLPAVGASSVLQGYAFGDQPYPTARFTLVGLSAVLVAWVAARGDATVRRQALVLCLLTLTVYGTIAAGRANTYQMFGIPPSDAARQLRYHYVSTLPLTLLLFLSLGQVARSAQSPALPVAALVAGLFADGYFYARSSWAVNTHADCRDYVAASVREIDRRIDAAPPGTSVEIPNEVLPRSCTGIMGYEAIPGWAGLFVLHYGENRVRGRDVYFLEQEETEGAFDGARHQRLWKLLLPPDPTP